MARQRWGSYASARTKSKAAVFADMLSETSDVVKAEAVDMPTDVVTDTSITEKFNWFLPVQSGRDFINGTLINTDIGVGTSGPAWLLKIEGNSYGHKRPFNVELQGYNWSSSLVYNLGGTCLGGDIHDIKIFSHNGTLAFWFPRQTYWQGFAVTATHAGSNENKVTTITDTSMPTSGVSMVHDLDDTGELVKFTGSWAAKEGPVSYNKAYSSNWQTGMGRGNDASWSSHGNGIHILKDGFYEVHHAQRVSGNSGMVGIAIDGNRSTLENRPDGIWSHDHANWGGQHSHSYYLGPLYGGELVTAGFPTNANQQYGPTGYSGYLSVKRIA